MAFSLLNQLLDEAQLTPGNVHQFTGKEVKHLLDTDEFKAIQKQDPGFAKKLELAWEGDARDFQHSQGKNFEPLFPKMLDPKAIAKFAPELKPDVNLTKGIGLLKQLHAMSFPTKQASTKVDNSVWSQERWARESEEFDLAGYELLKEEVEELFEE
jgi:hypothetical protein